MVQKRAERRSDEGLEEVSERNSEERREVVEGVWEREGFLTCL